MIRRHYGVPQTKPAPTGAKRPNGNAFLWGIVVLMIVLGVTLYGVSKTMTDAVNTTASAPRTTGQGSRAL
jgi:hypothetical protein